MMKIEDLWETYNKCEAEGFIQFRKDIDKDLAKSLLNSALQGIKRLSMYNDKYEKETHNYEFLFTEKYDILRKLIDAFLLFYKVRSSNHQCDNAYLCIKHEELGFDWNILETMRLVRNNVNYKGVTVNEEVWKSYKLKFDVYINTLTNEIEKRLKEV